MSQPKNVGASGQFQSIGKQNAASPNSMLNSATQELLGETVFNTVYSSQNQQKPNVVQSRQNLMNNPTVQSNYHPMGSKKNNIDNNMSSIRASNKNPIPPNQSSDLSIFKTVATGTQILTDSSAGMNNKMSQHPNINKGSALNSVMKNGKALNNIDINADTQSTIQSGINGNQSNFPQANNSQYNNAFNSKAQSIHVSKDPSKMNQSNNAYYKSTHNQNIKNSSQSVMTNTLRIPSNQNSAALQSQHVSAMQNNINASKQSMKSTFPMPPANSIAQSNTQFNSNHPIQPISGTLRVQDNNNFNQGMKNQSALNYPPNAQMSQLSKMNPVQSAMNQHHPNLPLNSQQMKSIQSNHPQSSFPNPLPNSSVKNSLASQQQQSIMQSQQIKNSLPNQVHSSVQNSQNRSRMNNSSLKKSDIRSSRNKSPPMVVKTHDGKIVSTQADSNGNPYSTTEEEHSIKSSQRKISNKIDEIKDVGGNKMGTGFRFYGSISKAGRNQNGETKTNQDTPLVHISVGDVKGFNLFGVLDGHGPYGHFVSQFCKNYLIRKMNSYVMQCRQENITTAEGIYEKLKKSKFSFITQTYHEADIEMTKQNQFDYNFSGTTCNLVLQFKKYLVCASVGDSRGILIFDNDNNTNQGIFPLSNDHKPDLPQELNRIMNNGGKVDKLTDQFGNKVGPNRVFKFGLSYPGLAMSRSLGDFQAKECGVITEPEIIEHKINHNSKYMVICSDGVWEFMKNEDVRNLGNIYFQKGEVGPFCSSLVKEAVKTWEQCDIIRDDITVVCVYF